MDEALDRAHRAVEKLGDLPVFEVLEAAEDEELLLLGGKTGQGAVDEGRFLGLDQPVLGDHFGAGDVLELVFEREGRFPLPQIVDVGVPGDRIEPDREAVLSPVGRPVLEDPGEDVLDQVLARRPVARHSKKEVEQGDVVALEQDRELLDPAVPDVLHDLVVGQRGLLAERGAGEVFRAISFTLFNKDLF